MGLFKGLFRDKAARPREGPPAAPSAGLKLRLANLQGLGRRERQEDSFAVVNAADVGAAARQGLFAVVADGMGGMAEGKAASEVAVEAFVALFHALLEEGDVPRQLSEGARAVSDGVFQRFGGQSGTTVVAVRVREGALLWVSVGDSAIYLKRDGAVFQLNQEHVYLNELYLAELACESIDKARAEAHPDGRRLSAFIGIDSLREVDYNRRPLPLQAGDVLLLCSDGVSGVLSPAELLEAMSEAQGAGCALLETLLQEKNLPEQDNYTAIMISCDE